MLRSILPDQISPEGKFSNFFELAKDEDAWEQKMEEYTNKLKSQTENEIRDITDHED